MPNMTIAYCPPNIIRSVTACYHGKDSQNYYSANHIKSKNIFYMVDPS